MKKKTVLVISFLVLAMVALLVFRYAEEIVQLKHNAIAYVLGQLRPAPEPEEDDFEERYSAYPAFTHSEDAWYLDTTLIYHAGGGIDGIKYTNSKEAMEWAVQQGNVLEIDFRYTEDGTLICAHEWTDITESEESLTRSEFEALKICGAYTPMTAEDLISFMSLHEDVRVVVDTKETDAVSVVRELIRLAGNREDIIDRFIVQLYDKGTKQSFLELHPFPEENFLFTCYQFGSDPESVLRVCMEENISVVTVARNTWDADTVKLFTDKGIILFEHTLNRLDHVRSAHKKGIHGFYTDYLTEADLPFAE